MNLFVTSAISALVPLIIGFIWYNPKVMGKAWMKSINMTQEQMEAPHMNMALLFGLTYVLSFMLSIALSALVIHQSGVNSLVVDGTPAMQDMAKSLINEVGLRYNTFKHGALHGVIAAIFFALPVLGINALFERRSAKYILIHLGYWVITLGLMGAIICQFVKVM